MVRGTLLALSVLFGSVAAHSEVDVALVVEPSKTITEKQRVSLQNHAASAVKAQGLSVFQPDGIGAYRDLIQSDGKCKALDAGCLTRLASLTSAKRAGWVEVASGGALMDVRAVVVDVSNNSEREVKAQLPRAALEDDGLLDMNLNSLAVKLVAPGRVGSMKVTLAPHDAELLIDGVPVAIPPGKTHHTDTGKTRTFVLESVPAGPHMLVARKGELAGDAVMVKVNEGAALNIDVSTTKAKVEEPPPDEFDALFWSGTGLIGAGVVAGAGALATGGLLFSTAQTPGPADPSERLATAQALEALTWALVGLSVVCIGSGVAVMSMGDSE